MSDTETAPAGTDLDDLTPEQLREQLAQERQRADMAEGNLRQVLKREVDWRGQQGVLGHVGEDFGDRWADAIERGAGEEELEALLDELDDVPRVPRKLVKTLREHAKDAVRITGEHRRREAEQAHRQAIIDAGAPPELADAVTDLLRDTEPTAEAVSDVMERYNLARLRDITGTIYDPAERSRRDAQEARRSLQYEGVPEPGVPLDQWQRIAAAEAAIVPGNKASVAASVAEKTRLLDRERERRL